MPKANGHIAVAGKIIIQLHGIQNTAQRQHLPRQHGGAYAGDHGVVAAQLVGKDHFFAKAKNKALDAVAKIRTVGPAGFGRQRCFNVAIAHDGPGDQLGKQRNIQCKARQAALHGNLPAVKIDHIAHGLKGVKADADGQHDAAHAQQANPCGMQAAYKEVVILKIAQQA